MSSMVLHGTPPRRRVRARRAVLGWRARTVDLRNPAQGVRRLFVGILVPSLSRAEKRKKSADFARLSDAFASEVTVLGLASAICETELTFSDDQSSLPPCRLPPLVSLPPNPQSLIPDTTFFVRVLTFGTFSAILRLQRKACWGDPSAKNNPISDFPVNTANVLDPTFAESP